jgi:hypothetical protein
MRPSRAQFAFIYRQGALEMVRENEALCLQRFDRGCVAIWFDRK